MRSADARGSGVTFCRSGQAISSEGIHFFFLKSGFWFLSGSRLRPQWRWSRFQARPPIRPSVFVTECHKTFAIIGGGRSASAPSLARKPSPVPKGCRARATAPQSPFILREAPVVFSSPSFKPRFSAVVWPVQRRHQSTPKPRANATMSGLRRPAPILGLRIGSRHFWHRRSSCWKRTSRHAASHKAQRNRGLPVWMRRPRGGRGPERGSPGHHPRSLETGRRCWQRLGSQSSRGMSASVNWPKPLGRSWGLWLSLVAVGSLPNGFQATAAVGQGVNRWPSQPGISRCGQVREPYQQPLRR